MLAMTAVIVEYTFKMCFYILQVGSPNIAESGITYPPTLPLDATGCINNTLINALKN